MEGRIILETQTGVFEAIKEILYVKPIFILGLLLAGGMLYGIFRKDKYLPKWRTALGTILMFYYLCVVFSHIVGIPTLNELLRLSSLGEAIFHPNISVTPLVNGITLEFILNIFCFIPLGFICPFMSSTFERFKNVVLLGAGVSLVIEISQLFTLFRATDINDLIANSLGTIIGFLGFKLLARMGFLRSYACRPSAGYKGLVKDDFSRFLPVFTVMLAFVCTFLFEF